MYEIFTSLSSNSACSKSLNKAKIPVVKKLPRTPPSLNAMAKIRREKSRAQLQVSSFEFDMMSVISMDQDLGIVVQDKNSPFGSHNSSTSGLAPPSGKHLVLSPPVPPASSAVRCPVPASSSPAPPPEAAMAPPSPPVPTITKAEQMHQCPHHTSLFHLFRY